MALIISRDQMVMSQHSIYGSGLVSPGQLIFFPRNVSNPVPTFVFCPSCCAATSRVHDPSVGQTLSPIDASMCTLDHPHYCQTLLFDGRIVAFSWL